MFCSKCGENLAEGSIFCPKCGNKVASDVYGTINSATQPVQSTNSNTFRYIIMGCAVILCILFFTLPLVQCSQDSNYNASGWEIATGTGKLFSENDKGYPLTFLLIVIPVILLIAAFVNVSFAILRYISITGLLAKIVFLIYANSLLNSDKTKGAFELTGFNWLILGIYVGLCAIAFYCAKNESEGIYVQKSISENTKLLLISIIISALIILCLVMFPTVMKGIRGGKQPQVQMYPDQPVQMYPDGSPGQKQTTVTDPSSPYIGRKPIFSWYTDIGTVTTKTKDNYSVSVVMNIGYDTTDTTAYSELSSKKSELQDFVKRYFSGKSADELQNEELLKREIKETLNKRYLETARVRDITFTKFDVMK